MVLAILLAAFYDSGRKWKWVAVGMLCDFCLRFYAGAGISPLGSTAMALTAFADLLFPRFGVASEPHWVAGKQVVVVLFLSWHSMQPGSHSCGSNLFAP
jgi:hypothetical protein